MRTINHTISVEPVDSLQVHPQNPRTANLAIIKQSIKVNGFYGTIIAQKSTRLVLAGNHRLIAARELGAKTLPVVWVDVDDKEARRILLADNRTSDLAAYDDKILTELLEAVHEDYDTLLGTGYSLAELSDLAGMLKQEVDADVEWAESGMPACDNEDLKAYRQILVSFECDEDVDEFARRLDFKLTPKTRASWFPRHERVIASDKVYE